MDKLEDKKRKTDRALIVFSIVFLVAAAFPSARHGQFQKNVSGLRARPSPRQPAGADLSSGYGIENRGGVSYEGYWVRYRAYVGNNNKWEWRPDGNVIYVKMKGQIFEGTQEELNQAQISSGIRVGDVALWFSFDEIGQLNSEEKRIYDPLSVYKGSLVWDNKRRYPNRFCVSVIEGRTVIENVTYSVAPQNRYRWVYR